MVLFHTTANFEIIIMLKREFVEDLTLQGPNSADLLLYIVISTAKLSPMFRLASSFVLGDQQPETQPKVLKKMSVPGADTDRDR